MFSFTCSNADIQFAKKELIWRFYTATKALPAIQKVELINKRQFAKAALDQESEILVIHIAALGALLLEMIIYFSQKTQISMLFQDEAPTPNST